MNSTTSHPHLIRRNHGAQVTRGGFTLLELTVAMAMAAILVASLYVSLRIVFRARASAEAVVEPARTAALAMEFLRIDLQNALPPTGTFASRFQAISGSGGPDDLIFCTTASSPPHVTGNGEIKQVELTLGTPAQSNEPVLIRRVLANLLAPVQVNPDEEILCRGVTNFHLRYFTGQEWVDTWDSTQQQNQMPSAVEVTLEFQRRDSRQQQQSFRYVRVFPLSCSTVSVSNPATGVGGLP